MAKIVPGIPLEFGIYLKNETREEERITREEDRQKGWKS